MSLPPGTQPLPHATSAQVEAGWSVRSESRIAGYFGSGRRSAPDSGTILAGPMRPDDGLYPWQVLRRAWHLVGHFDLLLGLFAAFVAVAGWEDLLSATWTDRLLLWAAILLALTFGAAVIIFAPWSLWREAKDELRKFSPATASPPTIELVPPLPLRESGVFARFMFLNTSPIQRTFSARVVQVDGLRPMGPEPPWPVPWRHGGGSWNWTLQAGDREMLEVAYVWNGKFHAFVLDSTAEGGRAKPDDNEGFLDSNTGTFRIRVWDHESGLLVAALALQVVDGSPDGPPKLSLVPDTTAGP
jgi:hypothetical protein